MRWAIALLVLLSACSKPPEQQISRYERGQQLYKASCIACHGDPKVGSFGPPIYGSSLQLIRLKVNKGEYPPGYVPKRQSRAMPVMNLPGDGILALYCYLNDKCKACPRKGGDCKDEKEDKQEGL